MYTHKTSVIPLWSADIPNHCKSNEVETQQKNDILWIEKVQKPTLEVFLPIKEKSTGIGIVICPGGGYQGLAYDLEGTDLAKWLNSKGIVAFVLKYRLPTSKSLVNNKIAPLLDAQRAIRLVRYNSEKWNVSKNNIGVLGFSAGGHLAALLGTRPIENVMPHFDQLDSLSARPDFMALIYPVVTMDSKYAHKGSRENLIGKNPKQESIDYYSNELHVKKDTPPTFIIHAGDDNFVSVLNSLLFYRALQAKSVYSELHIYPTGGHGFGLAKGKVHLETWTDRLYDWLVNLGKFIHEK